jgi:DNA-binding NtrC family response regulator
MVAHVLVVDDDLEIRRLLGRYLGEQGFRVSLAGNKKEFEEKLATQKRVECLPSFGSDTDRHDRSLKILCRWGHPVAPIHAIAASWL